MWYYWPTKEADAASFTRRIRHANLMAIEFTPLWLYYTAYPRPDQSGAFSLIGPINPPSKGHVRILAVAKCCTKMGEAMSLRWRSVVAITNFIKQNITCNFPFLNTLSDNCTSSLNINVRELLHSYEVDHGKLNHYYRKRNDQVAAMNKHCCAYLIEWSIKPKKRANTPPLAL